MTDTLMLETQVGTKFYVNPDGDIYTSNGLGDVLYPQLDEPVLLGDDWAKILVHNETLCAQHHLYLLYTEAIEYAAYFEQEIQVGDKFYEVTRRP